MYSCSISRCVRPLPLRRFPLRSLRLICLSVTHWWTFAALARRARFPSGTRVDLLDYSVSSLTGQQLGCYKTSPKRLVIAGGDFSKLAISACFRYGDTTSARGRSSARGLWWCATVSRFAAGVTGGSATMSAYTGTRRSEDVIGVGAPNPRKCARVPLRS